MWVSLTAKSSNRKVGPMPVSTTEEASCPSECPLNGTDCYARFGPLKIHWNKVSSQQRGDNWDAFCKRMTKFKPGTPFRHNQAGDLPKLGDIIDLGKLRKLVNAVRHMLGFTYTHYDPSKPENAKAIKFANDNGFTVNLSADSLSEADEYYSLGIGPVCTILPKDAPHRGNRTPGGLPIVVCPAQTNDAINCYQCMLCQKRNRKSIVGFLAHGTASKRLSEKVKNNE